MPVAATVRRVPDPRPISEKDAERIRAALSAVRKSQEELEKAVAAALKHGASIRAVAELGLSPNTVQKYGRAHGWPTEENRRRFYETRWDRASRKGESD